MSDVTPRSLSLAADGQDLTEAVVRFCRMLRNWGVKLPALASETALRALCQIDVTRRNDFRSALRIAMLQRPEDFALFTYLFNVYWRSDERRHEGPSNERLPNRPVDAQRLGVDVPAEEEGTPTGGFQKLGPLVGAAGEPDADNELRLNRAAPKGPASGARPDHGPEEQAVELERLARALSAQLATRPSRRRVPARRSGQPDPRAMLRRSLRSGGIPVEMRWRRRRVERTRLVLFCDVSRSMDDQATLFLEFAAAVLRRAWRVEVFLFATDLARVTDLWLDKSREELRELVPDCGGGTQLGVSLQRFLHDYGHCLLGRRSIVMILSDGLDAGDPALVGSALERLRARSRGVIWLNPLLALPGYEPRAQGMAAALPHVDVFAPAHDLQSLWRVVGSIREISTRSSGRFGVPTGLAAAWASA